MGMFSKLKEGVKDTTKMYDNMKTNRKLSYEELLEIMKEGTYSVGVPDISGKGIMRCIRFPIVNKYRLQVAISGTTVSIAKVYASVSGFAKTAAIDAVFEAPISAFEGESIDLNRATREVGETLRGLLSEKDLLKK